MHITNVYLENCAHREVFVLGKKKSYQESYLPIRREVSCTCKNENLTTNLLEVLAACLKPIALLSPYA